MERLPEAGPSALVGRVALQPDVWMAIVFAPGQLDEGVKRMSEEFGAVEETQSRPLSELHAFSAIELLQLATQQTPETILFFLGIEQLPEHQLRDLDRARNQLLGRAVLFCTTEAGIRAVATYCPNIYSWLGGQCFAFDVGEGVMNVEERLESLRAHYKLSDAAVIERAERDQLPSDPAFVEWLTLLGRGDLLGS